MICDRWDWIVNRGRRLDQSQGTATVWKDHIARGALLEDMLGRTLLQDSSPIGMFNKSVRSRFRSQLCPIVGNVKKAQF